MQAILFEARKGCQSGNRVTVAMILCLRFSEYSTPEYEPRTLYTHCEYEMELKRRGLTDPGGELWKSLSPILSTGLQRERGPRR